MLQVLRNRHNDHRREQILHGVKEELNDDKEFEQTLLSAQLLAMKLGHQRISKFHQNLQPLQLGD
jgi:hypothetical protein